MLEYNFNQLDDDFITLWSNFVLYHDTGLIIEPLQRLAEKGQVNAIQCWYLLKKPAQQNQVIDDIVDGYYGDSFNEALAIANRIYARTKLELIELKKQIAEYHDKGQKLALTEMYNGITIEEKDNVHFVARDNAIEQFRASEYAQQLIKAAELTESAAKTTKSCLIWERLLEIYAANPMLLDNNLISQGDHYHIRKALRKRLKQNKDDVAVKFALGKSLSFFTQEGKKELESVRILSELAKRPLISCGHNNSQQDSWGQGDQIER